MDKAADNSYEKFVKELRLQSRAEFRKQINIRLRAFDRLREDFNGGMRTEGKLNDTYNEVRQLTSWIEADERSPDRVHLLALVQSMYLATMQEMAEWHRTKDPEQMKSFYRSMANRAAQEAAVLKSVQNEAYTQRLNRIYGVRDKFDFSFMEYRIVYFGDEVYDETGQDGPTEDTWYRAQTECLERDYQAVCQRWRFTEKGNKKISQLQGNMQRHKDRIYRDLTKALSGIPETIANFERISRMEIPPPPPK